MALITAATVACDPVEKFSAGTKIQRGFEKLGEQKALTVDINIAADEGQIWAALKDTEDFDRRAAKLLAGMKVSYTVAPGKTVGDLFKNPGDNPYVPAAFKIAADGGKALIEIRTDGKKLYQRMDFKAMQQLSGSSGGPAGPMGDPDKLKSPLKEMFKGDWYAYDIKTFEKFAEEQGGDRTPPGGSSQLDAKSQQQLMKTFEKAIIENADFKDTGRVNGVDHVSAVIPAKKAVEDLAAGLKPLMKDKNSPFKSLDLKRGSAGVPDKNVSLDFSIRDGVVSALTVDVAQLAGKEAKIRGKLPVTFGFKGGAASVDVPSGVKEIKPEELRQALVQGSGPEKEEASRDGGRGGTYTSADAERDIKELEQFQRENPSAEMAETLKSLRESQRKLKELENGRIPA